MKINKFTSIIVVSYIPNPQRGFVFKESLTSLIETTKNFPAEIIVVDMCGNDIQWLNSLLDTNQIQHYIRNFTNLSFGVGRNQGYGCASGNYVCIMDNDIFCKPGWIESCVDFLESHPDKKIYTSQIEYPTGRLKERYDVGNLDGWNLNMRAGSNQFVIRRSDYDILGGFIPDRIAGTRWTDKAVRAGYVCAVSPDKLCTDIGLREGYNHRNSVGLKKILTNGEEVYLNVDEFKEGNPDKNYV